MEYAIIEQTTTLVIRFGVTDAEPLESRKYDIPETYGKVRRVFDPREGHLKILNGERVSITFYGPRLLKGGRASDLERLTATWSRRTLAEAPEWIQRIWREAGA
jgi:hypothetical protein